MDFKEKQYKNVLSGNGLKRLGKTLLATTIIASQVFTVLPTQSLAAESTSNVTETSAPAAPKSLKAMTRDLAVDPGVTERRVVVSTFNAFKAAVESGTANVIEVTGDFQFTSNVTVNSNMRIEGNGHTISAGNYQMIMKSTSIVDLLNTVWANSGAKSIFAAFNVSAAPTLNIIDNVQVRGYLIGGVGKLSMSINGHNNRFVSAENYGMDVNNLVILDGARIEQLEAAQTAIHVRAANASVVIGKNAYLNMSSNKGYAFDASGSSIEVGEGTVIKSTSLYGAIRSASINIKNNTDLTLSSGRDGYGIYSTGNINIGDNVKLKATGKGTAVYAFNPGAAITVGKNAAVDITSDSGRGFYSKGRIYFNDGSTLKLSTYADAIYTASTSGVQFGSLSNQEKESTDQVNIDIDSANGSGIYSGGPVIFGDDTNVLVKAYNYGIWATGTATVNFGMYSNAVVSSASSQGVHSGGTDIGDYSSVKINAFGHGIDNTQRSGVGLKTGKDAKLSVTSGSLSGVNTFNDVTLGENNTLEFVALSGYGIQTHYAATVKVGENSTMFLNGQEGLRQIGGSTAAFNVASGSTVRVTASDTGINTTGTVTFAPTSKTNIRAASAYGNYPAIKAAGGVTFNKDTMAYVETLSNISNAVFDISGAQSSKLVINGAKYIDFRQNNRNTTGHIVKGYASDSELFRSRVEINNMPQLFAWDHTADWSKTPTGEWKNVDHGVIPLSLRAGSVVVNYYGGIATGANIAGLAIHDYSRISTEAASTIERPVIDTIYTHNKTVTGTGVAGNTVVVTFQDGTTASAVVGANGKWSVDVPAGTTLVKDQTVVAYQTNGVNNSTNVITKVQEDVRVPDAPTVGPVKEGDTKLTGKGEPNMDITITLPDGTEVSAKTDANGDFTATIPSQKEGSEIKVTQTGSNGKESAPGTVTVTSNQKPVITATNKTVLVGSTFNPLTGVTATDKEDGNLTPKIVVSNNTVDTSKAGTYNVTYSVTDKDGNKATKTITVTVRANEKPVITATDKELKVGDTFNPLTGVTATDKEDGNLTSKITVTSNTVNTAKAGTYNVTYSVTDKDGNKATKTITVTVKANEKPVITATDKELKVGDTFNPLTGVTATDKEDGNLTSKITVTSNTVNTAKEGTYKVTYSVTDADHNTVTKTITVKVEDLTGSVTPDVFYLDTDAYVNGKFDGKVAKVQLVVNGTSYITINVANGSFRYYAKDKILNIKDNVQIIAYNATGKVIQTKPVVVKDSAALTGTVSPVGFALGKDLRVTGTYKDNIKKVALSVNGTVYSAVSVSADGTFQYYAKDKILSLTDDVKVIGYNNSGVAVSTVKVNVVTPNPGQGTLTPADFAVGTDARVIGTYTGAVKKVALEVNGTIYSAVAVATDGTFQYYAKDKILSKADVVNVIGYDSAGAVVQKKAVKLTDGVAGAGSITPVTFKLGTDVRVTGTYTGAVKRVALEVNGTVYSAVGVAVNGTFQYYAKDKILSKTDVVKVIGYDASNQVVDTKIVTIGDAALAEGKAFPAEFKLGTDVRVTGTYIGDVKKVAIEVNGTLYSAVGVATDGTFQYYAKDKVLAKTDVVKVIAYNANNQVVDTKTVTITDGSSTVTGDIFPTTYKIGDARVKGTYTGAVKKVGLEVNGKVFAYVPVATDGTFQYYAKDKIATDTDRVKVIAYDSTNTVIKTQAVTITK
ncbi:DUF5011 domain-containing protein [Listeria rocourtiae]|uniref:immunoglobulin-like domain-containing protein n=1 Tax=Listeria rocourtiae TaxID=647910 RepID=UPI001623EC64|nr:immunoglobulin-like domain-containing protein [Listeria rocourtiae]MBC1435400.1 DUF5011 domain-containing protein [Listeria rocourtiae]